MSAFEQLVRTKKVLQVFYGGIVEARRRLAFDSVFLNYKNFMVDCLDV